MHPLSVPHLSPRHAPRCPHVAAPLHLDIYIQPRTMPFTRCAAGEACASGLKARSQVFDWALSPAEISELTALRSPSGTPTIFQREP